MRVETGGLLQWGPPPSGSKCEFAMPDPNRDAEIIDILGKLPKDQSLKLMDLIKSAVVEAVRQEIPTVVEDLRRSEGLGEGVVGLTRLLAARSNESYENTLMKALTLYGAALDATEKGNRLAVLSPDDDIVHEIIGFDPVGLSPEPIAGR